MPPHAPILIRSSVGKMIVFSGGRWLLLQQPPVIPAGMWNLHHPHHHPSDHLDWDWYFPNYPTPLPLFATSSWGLVPPCGGFALAMMRGVVMIGMPPYDRHLIFLSFGIGIVVGSPQRCGVRRKGWIRCGTTIRVILGIRRVGRISSFHEITQPWHYYLVGLL